MNKLIWETPEETALNLAQKIVKIRKKKHISQQLLSKMSCVSYGSIKRFEQKGEISLLSFIQICVSLDIIDQVRELFTKRNYNNIQEVINDNK